MAAREDQPQLVVAHHGVGERRRLIAEQIHGRGLLAQPLRFSPQAVEGAVAGDHGQPGARVVGDTVTRPALEGDDGCVLHGVLGEVETAERPGQGGEDPPPLDPDRLGEPVRRAVQRYPNSSTGRTSTEPRHAPGIWAAQWIASSRSAHSIV